MKEKKTTEIATNVSSGAEKVEEVEKELQTRREENGEKAVDVKKTVKKSSPASKSAAQRSGSEEKVSAKKMNAESSNGKAEKESEAAKARVAAALKKKEEQAKRKEEKEKARAEKAAARKKKWEDRLSKTAKERMAERKAIAEKRAAEKKAKAEKHAAERKALIEKRKAEKEEKIRERAHRKANRAQAKHRAKNRNGKERESRAKGYGGWLAAVISLGAVTLALTTVVTIGAVDMKRTKDSAMSGYRSTTYELIGIMENVDNDLDRARVSASSAQQTRILTDLLVQARLAELDLEKMPVTAEADRNLTSFINRVAFESERMLSKLRHGGTLSAQDEEVLAHLYEINHSAREQLDEFATRMTDKDITSYLEKGEGGLKETLERLENATLAENKLGSETEGAGKQRNADAPPMGEENATKIEPSKAEDLCANYFAEYNIGEFQCVGETVGRGYTAYNVQGHDQKGTLLFAEVDCASGELLRFDYYEDCSEEKFDVENSKRIAEEFLTKLGYENMTAVRVRENGTNADFTFVYDLDGVVVYPDMLRVQVCRTRGIVTAMDATKYVKNHKERQEPTTKVTLGEAREKLHKGLDVESSRLAIVATPKGERAAYEFVCAYGEERYVIYTDATSGEELAIVNVKNLG